MVSLDGRGGVSVILDPFVRAIYGSSEGSSVGRMAALVDNAGTEGRVTDRGCAKREGSMLLGRKPDADVTDGIPEVLVADGAVTPEGLGSLEVPRGGEDSRPTVCDGAGETDRNERLGEPGRAMRDVVEAAGLAGRGIPPNFPTDGDSGREPMFASRATCGGGAGVWCSGLTGLLGPATRRRRSSSCVLSLGERAPTKDHTFSPTSTYTSLWMARWLTFRLSPMADVPKDGQRRLADSRVFVSNHRPDDGERFVGLITCAHSVTF